MWFDQCTLQFSTQERSSLVLKTRWFWVCGIIPVYMSSSGDVLFYWKQCGCWCTGEAEVNRDFWPCASCVVTAVWNAATLCSSSSGLMVLHNLQSSQIWAELWVTKEACCRRQRKGDDTKDYHFYAFSFDWWDNIFWQVLSALLLSWKNWSTCCSGHAWGCPILWSFSKH